MNSVSQSLKRGILPSLPLLYFLDFHSMGIQWRFFPEFLLRFRFLQKTSKIATTDGISHIVEFKIIGTLSSLFSDTVYSFSSFLFSIKVDSCAFPFLKMTLIHIFISFIRQFFCSNVLYRFQFIYFIFFSSSLSRLLEQNNGFLKSVTVKAHSKGV